MEVTDVQMRMYRNLEEIVVDEESPRKSKTSTSSSNIPSKASTLTQYYEELNYYDPFSHEPST